MRFPQHLTTSLKQAALLCTVTLPVIPALSAVQPRATPAPTPSPTVVPTPKASNPAQQWNQIRQNINHVIVIYQENWSFDGLYGSFPGANGLANASATERQVDKNGNVYFTLPQNDPHVPDGVLPNAPFDLARYLAPKDLSRDLIHRFYHEQLQIDAGRMDKYVAWSDALGLSMSHFDATNLPEGKLAQQYTMADNFFHAAFGGSFLNHQWLIAARTPTYFGYPASIESNPDPSQLNDNIVTPDTYVVNTAFSVFQPHPANVPANQLIPAQTYPTIGDTLSAKNLNWAWYAGGWNNALAGNPDPLFQFHHQPFVYFKNFGDGTAAKAQHLKDETDFTNALTSNSLPAVSFIKPLGPDNEHPGYASLQQGQQHVADLVNQVKSSPYWKDSMIVITYDENGGRWDHVPPPVVDRWGPGTRVPAIIISPFAKKAYVDHTQYDTTSILKFIERRWLLPALNSRDANANDLSNTLTFDTTTPGVVTPTVSALTASVPNGNVQLTFSGALNAEVSSDPARYTVTVNGHAVTVEAASYNGQTHAVILSLPAGTLRLGDQVIVSWTDLTNASGNSFSGHSTSAVASNIGKR